MSEFFHGTTCHGRNGGDNDNGGGGRGSGDVTGLMGYDNVDGAGVSFVHHRNVGSYSSDSNLLPGGNSTDTHRRDHFPYNSCSTPPQERQVYSSPSSSMHQTPDQQQQPYYDFNVMNGREYHHHHHHHHHHLNHHGPSYAYDYQTQDMLSLSPLPPHPQPNVLPNLSHGGYYLGQSPPRHHQQRPAPQAAEMHKRLLIGGGGGGCGPFRHHSNFYGGINSSPPSGVGGGPHPIFSSQSPHLMPPMPQSQPPPSLMPFQHQGQQRRDDEDFNTILSTPPPVVPSNTAAPPVMLPNESVYEMNRLIPAIRGAPVSALACHHSSVGSNRRDFDENGDDENDDCGVDDKGACTMSMLYVASHAIVGGGGGIAVARGGKNTNHPPSRSSANSVVSNVATNATSQTTTAAVAGGVASPAFTSACSILAAHSLPDGALYSTVAAHPAPLGGGMLESTWERIYNSTCLTTLSSTADANPPPPLPPPNAYRPPYGAYFHGNDDTSAVSKAEAVGVDGSNIVSTSLRLRQQLPLQPTTSTATTHRPSAHTRPLLRSCYYERGIGTVLTFEAAAAFEANARANCRSSGGSYKGKCGRNNILNNRCFRNNEHDETTTVAVITISPYGVRLHTSGGLTLMDRSLRGMMCGTFNPTCHVSIQNKTHVTVGGVNFGTQNASNRGDGFVGHGNIQCLDLSSSLRSVSTGIVGGDRGCNDVIAVSDIVSNEAHNAIVVGCSDGSLEVLDGRNLRSRVKVKAHKGGVSNIAVSQDGNCICTTGFACKSNGNSVYSFPDQHVLVFDVRMLGSSSTRGKGNGGNGRGGGVPHAFTGMGGGPRHLTFLPSTFGGSGTSTTVPPLLVASGQRNGGIQILHPFSSVGGTSVMVSSSSSSSSSSSAAASGTMEDSMTSPPELLEMKAEARSTMYYQPSLSHGETITSMFMDANTGILTLGTSYSCVIQLARKGYERTYHKMKKKIVCIPDIVPRPPLLSINPRVLLGCGGVSQHSAQQAGGTVGGRDGENHPFGRFTLCVNPKVSRLEEEDLNLTEIRARACDRYGRSGGGGVGSFSSSYHCCQGWGDLSRQKIIIPQRKVLSAKITSAMMAPSSSSSLSKATKKKNHNHKFTSRDRFIVSVPTESLHIEKMLMPASPFSSTEDNNNTLSEGNANDKNLEAITVAANSLETTNGLSSHPTAAAPSFSNPNQLIYNPLAAAACYDVNADPRKSRSSASAAVPSTDGTTVVTDGPDTTVKRSSDRGDREKKNDFSSECPEYFSESNRAGSTSIPLRYRRTSSRTTPGSFNFDYAKYNNTELWPGWDAGRHVPNSYTVPAIILLYFLPDYRVALLREQYNERLYFANLASGRSSSSSLSVVKSGLPPYQEGALAAELGFVFHQLDLLSAHARTYNETRVGAILPSNFLTTLASMPEAEALALLDGLPTGMDLPRRFESFYRFLMHHLDHELYSSYSGKKKNVVATADTDNSNKNHSFPQRQGPSAERGEGNERGWVDEAIAAAASPSSSVADCVTTNTNTNRSDNEIVDESNKNKVTTTCGLVDNIQGFNFTSINNYISSPSTKSKKMQGRTLMVDLSYDTKRFNNSEKKKKNSSSSTTSTSTSFSDILHASLCRESRIRAWCDTTHSYETIVQRRTISSLPRLLAVCCACAGGGGSGGGGCGGVGGQKKDDDALSYWRQQQSNNDDGGEKEGEGQWLPEEIQIELDRNSSDENESFLVIREKVTSSNDDKKEVWKCTDSKSDTCREAIPDNEDTSSLSSPSCERERRRRTHYILTSVVSYVRPVSVKEEEEEDEEEDIRHDDETVEAEGGKEEEEEEDQGYHVVHVRIPMSYKIDMLKRQAEEAERCALESRTFHERFKSTKNGGRGRGRVKGGEGGTDQNDDDDDKDDLPHLTLPSMLPPDVLEKNAGTAREMLHGLLHHQREERRHQGGFNNDNGEWYLFNGLSVTKTTVYDARSFSNEFKEPCLLIFQAINEEDENARRDDEHKSLGEEKNEGIVPCKMSLISSRDDGRVLFSHRGGCSSSDGHMKISPLALNMPSIGMHRPTLIDQKGIAEKGSLIAIDTEFVTVQHEKSMLASNGTKINLTERRNALARISLYDCANGRVLVDDYVLPQEPVLDYLTRFSGIRPIDLDPVNTPHNLVTTRTAYMKLRLFVDRGCIFVGHGLDKDFRILCLVVPPSQVVDTSKIFRKAKLRPVRLRFLSNYILGRDMQQDTHNSIEDCRAAYEIYNKSIELKKIGQFDKVLNDLYDYGRKTDWKLGVFNISD